MTDAWLITLRSRILEGRTPDQKFSMMSDRSAIGMSLSVVRQSIGAELDLSDKGLGIRSRRYALLADDGVVSHYWHIPGTFSLQSFTCMSTSSIPCPFRQQTPRCADDNTCTPHVHFFNPSVEAGMPRIVGQFLRNRTLLRDWRLLLCNCQ